MSTRPDALDLLLAPDSTESCAAVFRGYVWHALFFYRQNDLRGFGELLKIGRRFPIGTGGRPPARGLGRKGSKAVSLVLRGLFRHEPYWGSLRLSSESLADFEEAARLEPGCVWAWLFAGMTHEMHRRYTRGIRCFERAMALAPLWAWPYILRGICRWYTAEFRSSVSDFSLAARLDPKSEIPLLFMARAKADMRDRSLVADLDRALRRAPRSGFALSWRGRAMFVLRRTPEALEDLRRSIALLPDYDRGYSWLGVSYAELGRWREAVGLLKKAHALNPYYPTSLYPLARAYMELGSWAEAERAFKKAAAIDRHGVWVEHRISMSHPTPACLKSRADLDRFLARRPRAAWARAWRGQTELLLQNYRKAVADLDEAVSLDPRDPWARLWRGEARRRTGACQTALADFDAALKLSPKLGWAHAGRGFCLLAMGRPRSALAALDRSLSLQGHCAPALAWRGEAGYRLGRFRRSIKDLEAAIELHPQDHWVQAWLWRAKARLGDWEGARASLILMGEQGGSHNDEVWALRGWVEGRLGREAQAVAAFGKALALNPGQPLALLGTACWWLRHGEKARARYVLDAALEVLPGRLGAQLNGRLSKAPPRHLDFATVEALQGAADPSRFFTLDAMLSYCRRAGLKTCLRSLMAGDFRAAVRDAEKSGRWKQDVQSCLFRGWLRLKTGDAAGAVDEASRALDQTLDPHCRPALWLRAEAKGCLGEKAPEALHA